MRRNADFVKIPPTLADLSWSRHPNYFGEILLWIGVTLIAVPVLSGWQWVIIISPVFVTLLLTRVSGIPLLEARAAKRWGNDPEYQLYLATTPRLIPFPRSHSASQP
jgi:steroid 5-alpha reductase family enzyme